MIFEKETKERRSELQRYESSVLAKEEAVDKRSEAIEQREAKFTAKEEHLRQREAKVEELSQKKSAGTGKNLRSYLRTGKKNIC